MKGIFLALCILSGMAQAEPFTYQGQLNEGGFWVSAGGQTADRVFADSFE